MRQVILFLLLFLGCGKSLPQPEKTLRICFNAPPTTLDPRKSGDFASCTLVSLLYEGLMRALPGDEEVEMALAQRIELSEDGKIYTFHIREASWSDGQPITAHDFETSWKNILDPNFPSISSYLLFPIKNGEAYAKGEACSNEVGILALDKKTLRVELSHPSPQFLALTAFPLFFPVPSHDGADESVVSGPFRIAKIQQNSEISLVKNKTFWNRDKIRLDQIQIHIVADESTALEMFEQGALDWLGSPLSSLSQDALPLFKKRGNLRFSPMAASTFIAFNTEKEPFAHPLLRKAFSYAIDRERIVRDITQMGQIPASGLLPPSLQLGDGRYFFKDAILAQDCLKKALSELDLQELPEMKLYFRPGQVDKRLAQALQKEWQETLGISVRLEQIDVKSHTERLHQGEFQIALTSWIAQFHDPINLLERFKRKENLKNYSRWNHKEYAELVDLAEKLTLREERRPYLLRAEQILAEEAPLAPLYHWSSPSLHHPRLKNLESTASGGVLFERAFVED